MSVLESEVLYQWRAISSLREGKAVLLMTMEINGREYIPFEFVGKVASARAVAEAGYVERRTATRHGDGILEKVDKCRIKRIR